MLELFSTEERQAGVGVVRELINWRDMEPRPDHYVWVGMDNKIRAANEAGIEIFGYFIFTPDWAEVNPFCTSDICAIHDMSEFRQFAEDVARRYDGHHGHGFMKYIEILNEVTHPRFFDLEHTDYRDWLIAGYEGVKAGNPNATVLIGGFIDPLGGFGNPEATREPIDDMLQNYQEYYDVVNFHAYEFDAQVTEASVYMQDRMRHYGVDKPLWLTETATVTHTSNPDWSNTLARAVVKRYARAFGNEVERVFWWPFAGLSTPSESEFGREGAVLGLGWIYPKGFELDRDFHPRQAYDTYKLMTLKIGGFSSVQKITDTQYKFIVNGRLVYILWCDWGPCVIPSEISGIVTVTDYLGHVETTQASAIHLTEDPIFIERFSIMRKPEFFSTK